MLKTIALLFILACPLEAADLYVCWNYFPLLPVCQSPKSALTNWKPGDRIWLLGKDFKLLMAWDVNDPQLTAPVIPFPTGADIQVILKPGAKIKSVPITYRKGDTSTTAPILVNKSTKVVVR